MPGLNQETTILKAYTAINQRTWSKEKVISLMIILLDEGHFRIGNEYYAETNKSFGLSTLRRKHIASLKKDSIRFEFRGKKGIYQNVQIKNSKLARLIKKSAELPGYELFRYDAGGYMENVRSDDVNEYLRSES